MSAPSALLLLVPALPDPPTTGGEIYNREIASRLAAGRELHVATFADLGVNAASPADALAEAVHSIARVGPLSGDPYRLASELGMPPWRVQKAQKQARRWSRERVLTAVRLVAALNADVKGAAADADYVLENTVRAVAELAGSPS